MLKLLENEPTMHITLTPPLICSLIPTHGEANYRLCIIDKQMEELKKQEDLRDT